MEAQAIETNMGGASQNMFWARKHSGTIHAIKGWKKVVLKTLTMRSIESGANQESRCGGVLYGGGIVKSASGGGRFEMWLVAAGEGEVGDVVGLSDYQDELGV
jgi:hypothetical protein